MANIDVNSKNLHLANWFIKSSPHMPKVPHLLQKNGSPPGKNSKTNHHHLSPNPHWLPQGVFKPTPPSGAMPVPSSPFTSQTNLNLPLQIFTAPPYDGHKPKLRRFNSHDTSANMFSVTEFENNARMAKQVKQQWTAQCDSMNRKNSLNDYYSTSRESSGGHSRGAADAEEREVSVEQPQEIMPIDKFLLKSVLPKVVRVYSPNDSTATTTTKGGDARPDGGRLMFIYRHIPNRKIFKAHNSKSSDKRRCLKIPQDLKGYFSLVNEKGQATAAAYSKVIELVRERVYKFLTLENMVAYNESFSEVIPMKSQYVKTTIKAGQTFRILAVFEDDRSRNPKNGTSGGAGQTDREKIRGRYVQILSETRQMFYVPLTTKGKFYEVAVNSNQSNSSNNTQSNRHNGSGGAGINLASSSHHHFDVARKADYVYRISDLVLNNSSLPLNLKLIYAPSFVDVPDHITIEEMLREDILLGCAITEKENQRSPLQLAKLTVFPDIKLQKCLMGHRDERRLLASPMFQHWIEFCKTHSEIRLQAIEIEQLSQAEVEERRKSSQNTINSQGGNSSSSSTSIVISPSTSPPAAAVSNNSSSSNCTPGSNQSAKQHRSKVESLLRPLSLGKFLGGGRDKNYVAHEVEDSIIFLTKSDLEKIEAQKRGRLRSSVSSSQLNVTQLEQQQQQQQEHPQLPQTNTISDKMKVFEQEKRSTSGSSSGGGWFSDRKNNKTKTKSFTSYDILQKKLTANDRYSDMSKMIEERFGDISLSTLMRGNKCGVGNVSGGVKPPNKSSSVTDVSTGGGGRGVLGAINNLPSGSRYSLNKTFSLENISLYDLQPRSRHSFSASQGGTTSSQTPDLVRIINQQKQQQQHHHRMSSAASSVENIGQLYPTTSSQCLSSIGGGGRDESSFISEKLYNEFHVKTKMHSKSSTHLNRWPFQAKQNQQQQPNHNHNHHQHPRASPMLKKTSSIVNIMSEDYSNNSSTSRSSGRGAELFGDSSLSLVVQSPNRITIVHRAPPQPKDVTKEFINTNTEYYAEICNGGGGGGGQNNNHTSRTQIVNVL